MGSTLVRLAAVAAGGVLALAAATPASAVTDEYNLQADHRESFASDHDQECAEGTDVIDDRMSDRAENEDGWHFVLASGTFESITVVFAPGGDPDDAGDLQNFTGEPHEDTDGVVRFVFYDAGGGPNVFTPHAYVFAPAGWMLVDATATGEGGQQFIVSHTCAGEPGDDPGNGDKDPTPTPTPSMTTPGPTASEPSEETGKLPTTGSQVATLIGIGTVLLLAGGGTVATMAIRRRRNLSDLMDG